MMTSHDYQTQPKLEMNGGKAIHPSWEPFFDNCAPTSSRGMTATLYTRFSGKPITKTEIRRLWKSYKLGWLTRVMFTPDVNAILYHYQQIHTGHPVDSWVRPVIHSTEGEERCGVN
jgi:hypothetical protein